MLVLDLGKIRTAQTRVEQLYPPDSLGPTDGYRIVDPVSLQFDIFKDKRHFRLVGQVRSVLELPCSRCLEPFVWPVEASFDLRYQPRTAAATPGEAEIEEDDLTAAFYDDDEIDLGELVREQLELSLPMKPLCASDCRGLCPTCGVNLNRGTCTCTTQWTDPRLAALAALKKES